MEENCAIQGEEAPTQSRAVGAPDQEVQRLYTPKQVQAGAFLGGPLAAVFYLWKNFQTLKNPGGAKWTLRYGLGFTILLILLIPWFPERTPNYILPFAYAWGAYYLVTRYQRSKEQIQKSPELGFHSNWKVTGIALAGLIAFAVPALGFAYWMEVRKLPPHQMVKIDRIHATVEALEQRKQEKAYVIFAFAPPDAKVDEDDVNLEYRIVEGTTTLMWFLNSKRNIADKDRIKQFAEQQGVTLFEVQGSDSKLLFSQDSRVKDLGTKILRDFYRLSPSTKVMVVEGQS